MSCLNALLTFVDFTHKFQQIKRRLPVKGEERFENDLEHSGQLALVGWFLVKRSNLAIDPNKVIQYALFHDFVEVYAGDTPAFNSTSTHKSSQKERENEAIEKLRETLPEFIEVIDRYESQNDLESKFVYALDKFIPIINNYLDQGRSWKMNGVTLEKLLQEKTKKIEASDDVKSYFDELVTILKRDEKTYFAIS